MIAKKYATLAAIVVCALVLPVPASTKNPVTRPVKIHGHATVTVVDPLTGECQLTEWGQATHTGRYSNTGSTVMDLATGSLVAGYGTVVTANGDTIDWVIPAPYKGQFTGGTGRFQGITGGWDNTQMSPQPPVFNLDGTITLVITYVGLGEATY